MDSQRELEKAKMIVADLEQLIMSQNVPYLVHFERLTGLKYIHARLEKLARLESESENKGSERSNNGSSSENGSHSG
tara:strand:+ start:111 stop:341 length:231 start_codon:yes stop_codon:yes gene_type:complete